MAYAAVISLKHTIRRLESPFNTPQITISAHEELNSLVSMLKRLDDESSRSIDRRVINEVDAKIRDEVWKVEDVLESFLSLNISSSQGCLDEMNSFLKKVKILREEYYRVLRQNSSPAEEEEDEASSGAVPEPVNESTTVGLSDLSHKIINQLVFGIGPQSDPHFVSVVGMAGIVKTHLAVLIYHHPRILQHFHEAVWVVGDT
ncbi:hypothetical protein C2S52_008099 [Perilla frutescens var. hirtella]|nr:hypothetical protein C2S52_008099 [Perilla frutescens var. hirtella]